MEDGLAFPIEVEKLMAVKIPVVIDQGTSFSSEIELTNQDGEPLDVTNMAARGQIRKHYTSSTATDFSCDLANGMLIISLTSEQTRTLLAGRYVYDIELVDGANNVHRLFEGVVTVTPEVTRG
jgi:hypothetical protein